MSTLPTPSINLLKVHKAGWFFSYLCSVSEYELVFLVEFKNGKKKLGWLGFSLSQLGPF
jgi:hypothetical protein